MVRDPTTGKYRRTRLFVLTLGCSRKAVRLLTWRSSAQIWAELHERAFRRLGGTVEVIVLDNLSEGVLTPDIYDPALNPLYRDVLAHYGVVALPCRVGDPDRKGKVEAGVGHAQKTPLKRPRFETIEAAQAYLDRWEERWADTRIHGTTKRQVAVMFAEERPALGPLPLEPFRYYRFGERTVHLDGCVEVDAAYYGAPPGWIGHRVQVQWTLSHIRIDAKRQAIDALDAARRRTTPNGNGPDGNGGGSNGRGPAAPENDAKIPLVVALAEGVTSRSRHSLALSGDPPHAKLLIPMAQRAGGQPASLANGAQLGRVLFRGAESRERASKESEGAALRSIKERCPSG